MFMYITDNGNYGREHKRSRSRPLVATSGTSGGGRGGGAVPRVAARAVESGLAVGCHGDRYPVNTRRRRAALGD